MHQGMTNTAAVMSLLVVLLTALTVAKAYRKPERFAIDVQNLTDTGKSNVCMAAMASYNATCPIGCVMSDWSEWSECSGCGSGGTQSRTRTVLHDPANGAAPCGPTRETRTCKSPACSVDCKLSGWTPWSACTAACNGGTQMRARTIATHPSGGGAECGSTLEQQSCNMQACAVPVDCQMTGWSGWSGCSKTCGGGVQTRTRGVVQQAKSGGAECGPTQDQQSCNMQACAKDVLRSHWNYPPGQQWSTGVSKGVAGTWYMTNFFSDTITVQNSYIVSNPNNVKVQLVNYTSPPGFSLTLLSGNGLVNIRTDVSNATQESYMFLSISCGVV